MLNKIKEFQRDASRLNRNANSIEEFKIWLNAGRVKINSANGTGIAKIVESEQQYSDNDINEEIINIEIMFNDTFRRGLVEEDYTDTVQQCLDEMEQVFNKYFGSWT